MKNKQLKTEQPLNQTVSPYKSERKAVDILVLLFASTMLRKLMYYLNACYLIHILSYAQNVYAMGLRPRLNKINFHLPLCIDMTSIMVSWHTSYYNLMKVLSTNFCGMGSICEGNIFMLKFQT